MQRNQSPTLTFIQPPNYSFCFQGIESGDAVLEIAGQRIERGSKHSSVAQTIKSMPRPFQMSFLPPGVPDPDTVGTAIFGPSHSAAQAPPIPNADTEEDIAQGASAGTSSTSTAVDGLPVEALYRPIEVTFGPGPMGIDLVVIIGKDHLVKGLLGATYGGANPDLVAVKRTIGQAQSLGIKALDIITAINGTPVTPGTSIPNLKAMIGAAQRPITVKHISPGLISCPVSSFYVSCLRGESLLKFELSLNLCRNARALPFFLLLRMARTALVANLARPVPAAAQPTTQARK